MAVPKRRTSSTRRDKRRAHWKLSAPTLVPCPQCHELKPMHRVCLSCGHYKNREAVKVE
ncbi:MAG: 50S ribosomal protein L32 [Bacillota bacterium]